MSMSNTGEGGIASSLLDEYEYTSDNNDKINGYQLRSCEK